MPEGGSAGWWSGVEWGSPGPLIIFTGGAGLVTPKHESVTTQTWASSHWLAVRGSSQQHMAVLLLCALSDNILMFPWIVNGNLVILDLDFEFQLATSVFYRAYLTTVLRGKDVANGILWEKKPNWQNTGCWSGEQVGPEGPEVNWSPLVEMSPWLQFDSNA